MDSHVFFSKVLFVFSSVFLDALSFFVFVVVFWLAK